MTEELKRNCKLCAITTLGQDEYIDCLEEQYEELEKENEDLKLLNEKMETWINRIRELKEENEQLKAQNLKMRNCVNCKHYCINDEDEFDCCRSYNCTKFGKWELAE